MTAHATGFHHVGLISRDMSATIARYEQLARRVTGTIICADDPKRYAEKYSRYTGGDWSVVDGAAADACGSADIFDADPIR